MRLADDIGNLLELLGSDEGSDVMYAVRYQIATQAYMNYHYLYFINTHLEIINSMYGKSFNGADRYINRNGLCDDCK